MDIAEAITKRKSIRKFLPNPVEKEVLREVLKIAGRAPSAINTQPWKFTVIAGEVLDKIKKSNVEKVKSNISPNPEFKLIDWPSKGVYRQRQVEIGKQLFKLMGIAREDKKQRTEWSCRGFRYFDAPAAILLTSDRSLPLAPPVLDIGAVMQNICLAAMHFNLGTCIENQGVMYPDVLRKFADIPESRLLITSIAIGYPDWDFPANRVESEREPIDNLTTWCGL